MLCLVASLSGVTSSQSQRTRGGHPEEKSSKREHIMYRHHRHQGTKIPANGHLSKGRSAAIARTATEIAQYEEAVENDANPGMPCCFDSRKSASRDGSATATIMPTDPPLLGGRRLVMPGPTRRYKTGRSPMSAHIHGKLNREEGNPQKLGEESTQHALRATAKNRPPTVLLASSSISTKCCLARSASCDDVGNLKFFLRGDDLAGARLGAATAEAAAAAARRREQGVSALLRREHQEFGSSIDSTSTMTIKTRSKQNAVGKGDSLNGKGRSGRGGSESGRLGGQKKDEQRGLKTPTRPKGKRGAVATPKGAIKPDQNKQRAGGTPDGRKATAPKMTEPNLCPDEAALDEKEDEEGAEDEDDGDAGEDDDGDDANDAADDGEVGDDDSLCHEIRRQPRCYGQSLVSAKSSSIAGMSTVWSPCGGLTARPAMPTR